MTTPFDSGFEPNPFAGMDGFETVETPYTSADLLRDAAVALANTGRPFEEGVASLLFRASDQWARMVTDTQRPSAGVDQPPAVHYGQPDKAVEAADTMFRREIATARAWMENQ